MPTTLFFLITTNTYIVRYSIVVFGCTALNPFCKDGASCECSGATCNSNIHSTCKGIDLQNTNGVCQCGILADGGTGEACDATTQTPVCTPAADNMVNTYTCQVNMLNLSYSLKKR